VGGFSGFISHILHNACRIRNACQTLAETDQSILEIALASGFQNLANFNRQFRKTTGMPPREYRKLRNPR
jgi:AraC-like DNA-binding protein